MTSAFFLFLADESSELERTVAQRDAVSSRASKGVPSATDQAWVAGVRAGDQTVFDQIVERYAARLVRFAALYTHDTDDAEDVVADVFGVLWSRRARLDVRGGLETYLFGAVRNNARQRHRNVTRRVGAVTRFVAERGMVPAMGAGAESEGDEQEGALLDAKVRAMIDALPDRARIAITLRWYEQMEYEAIATILEISVAAARQTVHRALVTLRARLLGELGSQ